MLICRPGVVASHLCMGDVMDLASLRRELEEHLKHNPHDQAPEGFRDRFEHWAEAYEAEQDEESKAELATLLRRIPEEAEAAAKAGQEAPGDSDEGPSAEAAPGPADDAPPRPAPAPAPVPGEADAGPQDSGGGSTWLIVGAIVLALAAAAYFAFR